MESLIDRLLELHRQQVHLNQLKEKARSATMGIAARQRQVDAAREAVQRLEDERKKDQRLADAKELDVKALQGKTRKLREQLNAIETNREYKALQNEIKFAGIELRRAEDEELAAMDQLEQHEGGIRSARETLKAAEAALDQAKADTAAKADALQSEVRKAERDLRDIAREVPQDALTAFNRVAAKHPDGAMCALVRDDNPNHGSLSCGGCHMRLTENVYVRLVGNRNEFILCPNCSRILYVEP